MLGRKHPAQHRASGPGAWVSVLRILEVSFSFASSGGKRMLDDRT